MKIDTKVKALADKYIHDVYNYSDIHSFEPLPNAEKAYENMQNVLITSDTTYEERSDKEDLLIELTNAYLEQGIYYGMLYIVERIREIKKLIL